MVFEVPETNQHTILLFKAKTSECVFLKQGLVSVALDNFKSIADAGYLILAVVLNSRLVAPYTTETTSDLTISVKNGLWFNHIQFYVNCEGSFKETTISANNTNLEYSDYPNTISLDHSQFEGQIGAQNNTVTRTANSTD